MIIILSETELRYSLYQDGQLIEVFPLKECFQSIEQHIKRVEDRNLTLAAMNESLKNEHYKDAEIQRLQNVIKVQKEEMDRGFPISEEDFSKIQEWIQKHDEEVHGANYAEHKYRHAGAIGGSYTYEFTPTSIGTFGRVKCTCGEHFDFGGD